MFSKIRDNLFLSSAKDITDQRIIENNIDIILNVSDDSDVDSDKAEKVKMSFADNALAAKDKTAEVIDSLCNLLNQGKTVVVHCKVGASRSPHIVCGAISVLENRCYHEVYDEIRKLHPRAMQYSMGMELEEKFGSLFIK